MKVSLVFGERGECEAIAKKLISEQSDSVFVKYMYCESDVEISVELFDILNKVDRVYISPSAEEEAKNMIINFCLGKKYIDAFLVPKTFEISILNASPIQVGDTLTLRITSFHLSLEQKISKRLFDVLVSSILLVVLSPFLVFISCLIKFYDGGPVFFRQERVTLENTKFRIFKFRSMIPNAESKTGAVQASENDPRITPLGRVIRATRIDELPQLINVVKGEMSLVGPRALRIEEVEKFQEDNSHFKFRANVKAGITGLAQTLGRYDTSFEDKLRLDLLYIRNYSFFRDLVIMLDTFRVIFDTKSSRGISGETPFIEFVKYYGMMLHEKENYVVLERVV